MKRIGAIFFLSMLGGVSPAFASEFRIQAGVSSQALRGVHGRTLSLDQLRGAVQALHSGTPMPMGRLSLHLRLTGVGDSLVFERVVPWKDTDRQANGRLSSIFLSPPARPFSCRISISVEDATGVADPRFESWNGVWGECLNPLGTDVMSRLVDLNNTGPWFVQARTPSTGLPWVDPPEYYFQDSILGASRPWESWIIFFDAAGRVRHVEDQAGIDMERKFVLSDGLFRRSCEAVRWVWPSGRFIDAQSQDNEAWSSTGSCEADPDEDSQNLPDAAVALTRQGSEITAWVVNRGDSSLPRRAPATVLSWSFYAPDGGSLGQFQEHVEERVFEGGGRASRVFRVPSGWAGRLSRVGVEVDPRFEEWDLDRSNNRVEMEYLR